MIGPDALTMPLLQIEAKGIRVFQMAPVIARILAAGFPAT
jgi:hypothetical protein